MSDELAEYRRKRRAGETPEPFGARRSRAKRPIFVVQRHDARRLHYDFRLERGGALASWAVPKGVPLEAGQRALAVHVEDHPLDYAGFEGEIPKGNYGAGTVEIWDRGDVRPGGGEAGRRPDRSAPRHAARRDVDARAGAARRQPEELAADAQAGRGGRPRSASGRLQADVGDARRAAADGPEWSFEVKWDGYRALGYVREGEARLVSRNGNDLTERFRDVARALERAVRSPECVVDGEVCALDEEGRPSFSAMQQGKRGTPLVYEVFDVLELDGSPVLDLPLDERRRLLDELIDRRQRMVQISGLFDDGELLLEAAQAQKLEGVMAKRRSSPYCEGRRTRHWLKLKTHGRQEFVICGWTRGEGRRSGRFGSLVLGVYRDGGLEWVGNVGTGFADRVIDELLAKLEPLRRATSPLRVVPKMAKVRAADVSWVEPRLVCEVEFTEWTHDGHLRAPSFKGLRDDKSSGDVRREEPIEAIEQQRGGRLKLSNLDKVFWPDEGITKGDLLDYYRTVAPVIVPHLRGRPFTMRRYPDGAFGKAFFQKDAPKHMPEWIERFRAQVSTRESPRRSKWIEAPVVNDEDALLWMVNMGCIDMNTWYSRVDRPDRPDFVLFDLDPSPDVGFAETVQVALIVKAALDALGLQSFPKTSSADGMHVLVPVERRYTHDDTREFSEIVAGAIARTHRGLATTEWTKARRRGVLIDSNQNGEGKTIASVYSVRPRPGAPVSTPLRWDEVDADLDPASFTMDVVLERVREQVTCSQAC